MLQNLQVKDETSTLKAVILGIAQDSGPTPTAKEAYDPKSLEHILAGTYPLEKDMISEMDIFLQVLNKYGVTIYRPSIVANMNQIFVRDIGFVIDHLFIKGNILPERAEEWNAIADITQQIPNTSLIVPPLHVHIEGGDIILYNNHIFVGTYRGSNYSQINTARTNLAGVDFIRDLFPTKTVRSFDLHKSMTNPRENALHLDCCFQPVGDKYGIIYEGGFRNPEEFGYLVELLGRENLFFITADEMYQMYSNVFSISKKVVVSEQRFTRLNTWLKNHGFTVEEIPYHEIGKQEGLLRCSTLPLIREYNATNH